MVLTSVCLKNCPEAVRLSPCCRRPPQTEPRAGKSVPGAASPRNTVCVSSCSVLGAGPAGQAPGEQSFEREPRGCLVGEDPRASGEERPFTVKS